jgi:hypothetical protein
MTALRAVKVGDHAQHDLLHEARDGAGDESTKVILPFPTTSIFSESARCGDGHRLRFDKSSGSTE